MIKIFIRGKHHLIPITLEQLAKAQANGYQRNLGEHLSDKHREAIKQGLASAKAAGRLDRNGKGRRANRFTKADTPHAPKTKNGCSILKEHIKENKEDPERLKTGFILGVITDIYKGKI